MNIGSIVWFLGLKGLERSWKILKDLERCKKECEKPLRNHQKHQVEAWIWPNRSMLKHGWNAITATRDRWGCERLFGAAGLPIFGKIPRLYLHLFVSYLCRIRAKWIEFQLGTCSTSTFFHFTAEKESITQWWWNMAMGMQRRITQKYAKQHKFT